MNSTMPVPQQTYPLVLERLVRDVSIPMDRLREAEAFVERQEEKLRAAALNAAVVRAQQSMSAVARDMDNKQTQSKYASLAQVDRAIRPHYSKEGLAPTFTQCKSDRGEGWICIVCNLLHDSGSARKYTIDVAADGLGPKGNPVMTKTHAIGSGVTYGRRQLLKMIFNLAEADDDGNASARLRPGLDSQQVQILSGLLAESGITIAEFCNYANLDNLADLESDRFEAACTYVKKQRKEEVQ